MPFDGGTARKFVFANDDEARSHVVAETPRLLQVQIPTADSATSVVMDGSGIVADLPVDLKLLQPRFSKPSPDANRHRFVATREWECKVLTIDPDTETFVASLMDLASDEEHPEEFARFEFRQVSLHSLDLIQPDAIFNWAVGTWYHGKNRDPGSRLVFRRLPGYTENELNNLKEKAAALGISLSGG